MNFKIVYYLFFLLSFSNIYSYEILIKGNKKLTINDLQAISDFSLSKKNYTSSEIDILIKDLYSSDLIYDIDLQYSENQAEISIVEAKIINNVYINGNIHIDDSLLIQQLISKKDNLLSKNKLQLDLNTMQSIYSSRGYNDASISTNIESFSDNKVNLIFYINEGKASKITKIDFLGNKFFSDGYLNNVIISETISPINIFSKGSILNKSIFEFDIEKISNLYKNYGFFDIRTSYNLINIGNNNFKLEFIIEENSRYQISNLKFNLSNFDINNSKILKSLNKDLSKNNFLFNQFLIEKYLKLFNDDLKSNNIYNSYISYSLKLDSDNLIIIFDEKKLEPIFVNKIDIYGNTITKDKTIRSKLLFEPGDIFNDYLVNQSKEKLTRFRYINSVEIEKNQENDSSDISININENKKTGNFMFGGSLSGDTGFGLAFSIKDYNIFGSGNEISSSFNLNSEKYLFDISYTAYPYYFNNLKNVYNIYNSEDDFTNSYGFKSKKTGFGYGISFDYNEKTNIFTGINLSNEKNHSQVNSNVVITDNIGEFDQVDLNLSLTRDTTNDILYPTSGSYNKFTLLYSPETFSNNSYYKINFKSNLFKSFETSDGFIFASNNIGFADAVNGNLRTINTFSLGGNSFKGFDYRGVGPIENNIYLGGNKYFTSTFGYGDNFIFDEKDNVNMKVFYTTGSIWDSDYSNNKFELRSSLGVSFDFQSVIPVSLSYSIPLTKNTNDKVKEFNFLIGTSF